MAEEFEEEGGRPDDGIGADPTALHLALSPDTHEARASPMRWKAGARR